nr:PAAR domain-containing protein [Chitinivorax tropicus]
MGDRTSHGGVVITGDPTWTIDGQPIARVGDKVTCPRCKVVSTIISSRFPSVTGFGRPVAYDQDMTACGAVLYSRHNDHTGWGTDDDEGDDVNVTAAPIEEYAPKQALRFQEHFILHDNITGKPLTGVPYTIRTGEGRAFTGETDEQGRTDVVWTDSPLPVEVVAHPKPVDDTDPYHYAELNYEGL